MVEDWAFKEADTKYLTHGLHYYPARMIPQIAKRLLFRYSNPGDLVLDPFVGSGTTLVEARLSGRNSIGIDVNPFSALLATVKSTPISGDFRLQEMIAALPEMLSKYDEVDYVQYYPNLKNVNEWMEKWFPVSVIKHILIIKKMLFDFNKHESDAMQDFYKIMFSKLILDLFKGKFDGSSTHVKKKHSNNIPDPFSLFEKNVRNGIRAVQEFSERVQPSSCIVHHADFMEIEPEKLQGINLIMTSPPYGEERSTIGYSRWTKFFLYWLDYTQENVLSWRKKTLGGKGRNESSLESATLNKNLTILERKDVKHRKIVRSFFHDYSDCLKKMASLLETDSYCCIVCGNRRVAGVYFPMDKITAELASPDFILETLHHRDIPTKTIPWEGISGKTMKRENIIILKRK
ncbi:MAG: TRM11 family SAM-dependent methyltransferase [Candidatus Helarchaeota archaeon]